MADKCRSRGRETAVTPISRPMDDGRLSYEFLLTKAARRFHVATEVRVSLIPEGDVPVNQSAEPDISELTGLQDSRDADEEDPFGHGALLYQPHTPMGMSGHAIPDRSVAQTADIEVQLDEALACDQEAVYVTAEPPTASASTPDSTLNGAHATHVLTRTAHVVWCRVCGRHAAIRLGVGLQRPCVGFAAGAYPARIIRLRERRHPISGQPLDASTPLALEDPVAISEK